MRIIYQNEGFFYVDYENMEFNEIERNINSQNINSNLQRDRLKNTKENVFIWFFAFDSFTFSLCQTTQVDFPCFGCEFALEFL